MALPKRYKYRLEALLIVKGRNKKNAEIELAQARKKLEEEKKELKALEGQKEEIVQLKRNARFKMSQHVSAGESRVFDSSIHLNYLEKLQEDMVRKDLEITQQHEKIEKAKQRLERAKQDFILASRELQAMEKHKEMWIKKVMKELDVKEQKQLGELANATFQIKKMAEES